MAKWFPPQASTAERTGLTPDDGSIFYDEDEQTMYIGDGSTSGGNTLKGDTGPQGPPGTLTAVLDDLTPQLGGFLDPNNNYIGMDTGGNLASASPLVIGTDGDRFNVTGTTGFAVMTVAANRSFILRFVGVLTITHSASIEIPGGANFTTAAGDQLLCLSIATNFVQILGITKADGTPVAVNLSQDLSPQCGGFLDPNNNYIGSDKGGDLASASPLVIGVDGDYFDVTGTTGFAVMTVAANRFFILQFDAVLIITNGASITIPGGVNFTTAVGDQLLCFSTATDIVRIVNVIKADGTPVVVAGGAWNFIGTVEASDDATLTITGLDSTYDTYAISISSMRSVTGTSLRMRTGDSGGIDSAANDYEYHTAICNSTSTSYSALADVAPDHIHVCTTSTASDVYTAAMLFLQRSSGSDPVTISGVAGSISSGNSASGGHVMGVRKASTDVDRVQVFFDTGNIESGRMTIWGISHASS